MKILERFIITKDEHLQLGFRNKYRKPGWEEDVFKKHQFIIDCMTKNNIKYKLTTGDILDKQTGWSFKQYLANKRILEMYKNANIQIFSIAGNHDMIEGRNTIKDSVFEEFKNQELIKHEKFWNFENIIFIAKDFVNIGIDIEKEEFLENIKNSISYLKSLDKKIGLVLHQNITPEPERVTEITYQELADFDLDTVIAGHYHKGFPPQVLNNTLFIDPWNLWRVVRNYEVKEELHTPEFVDLKIVEKDSKIDFEFETIKVPYKKYSEAFDIAKVENYKNIKKEVFSFFNNISLDNFDETDEIKILEKIKTKFGLEIDPNLVNDIIEEIKRKFEN